MDYFENDFRTIPARTEPIPCQQSASAASAAPKKRSWIFYQVVGSLLLCASILLSRLIAPGLHSAARDWLAADEIGVAEMALQHLVIHYCQGEPISEAVMTFCQELIDAQNQVESVAGG